MSNEDRSSNRYKALLEEIFLSKYREGDVSVDFERGDLVKAAETLGIDPPSNLGDAIYAFRYRIDLPRRILDKQPQGREWTIEGAGRSKYRLVLKKEIRIEPNPNLISIKNPDATPEIIREYALTDEQSLLARVRYNRLLDIFLGIATFSLQNHLRTAVKGVGQIEIDEVYVGIDRHGCQYIIPVQAKGGKDRLSVNQTMQDIQYCADSFSDLVCRAISVQFIQREAENREIVALFELTLEDDEIKITNERHYELVRFDQISKDDMRIYAERAQRDAS